MKNWHQQREKPAFEFFYFLRKGRDYISIFSSKRPYSHLSKDIHTMDCMFDEHLLSLSLDVSTKWKADYSIIFMVFTIWCSTKSG